MLDPEDKTKRCDLSLDLGYSLDEPEDQHPLAWHRIIEPEGGCEADAVVTGKLRQQTRKRISAFPGRTKEIEGRQYLSFADYLKWKGRHAKGDLKSGIDTGLVVADRLLAATLIQLKAAMRKRGR